MFVGGFDPFLNPSIWHSVLWGLSPSSDLRLDTCVSQERKAQNVLAPLTLMQHEYRIYVRSVSKVTQGAATLTLTSNGLGRLRVEVEPPFLKESLITCLFNNHTSQP